jgi:hypothetical protein
LLSNLTFAPVNSVPRPQNVPPPIDDPPTLLYCFSDSTWKNNIEQTYILEKIGKNIVQVANISNFSSNNVVCPSLVLKELMDMKILKIPPPPRTWMQIPKPWFQRRNVGLALNSSPSDISTKENTAHL